MAHNCDTNGSKEKSQHQQGNERKGKKLQNFQSNTSFCGEVSNSLRGIPESSDSSCWIGRGESNLSRRNLGEDDTTIEI